MPGPSPPCSSSAGSSSALLPLGLLSHLPHLLCSGSPLTSGFGLTRCMGDPDLAQTIAEVQGALERLRISVENRAARSSSPWVVVRNPSPIPNGSSSAEALPVVVVVCLCPALCGAVISGTASRRWPPPGTLVQQTGPVRPAFGQRRSTRALLPLPTLLLCLASGLLSTSWRAASGCLDLPGTALSVLSGPPWVPWRTVTPSVTPSRLLPRPGCSAWRLASPSQRRNESRCFEGGRGKRRLPLCDQVAPSPGCLRADAISALAFAWQARCFPGGPACGLASGGGFAFNCRASVPRSWYRCLLWKRATLGRTFPLASTCRTWRTR